MLAFCIHIPCNLVLYSYVTMSHACMCTQKAASRGVMYLIHQFPFRLQTWLVNLILRLHKLNLVFLQLIGHSALLFIDSYLYFIDTNFDHIISARKGK